MGLGSTAQSAMKLLATMVFLGLIMMWIIMPTKTFLEDWQPKIHARINPTFFGKLGVNIVLYTFPTMFIATIGCLYLHMQKKNYEHSTKSAHKSSRLSSWKRPVLLKGPLGIVSWIELSFLAMFLAMLVWYFYAFYRFFSTNLAKSTVFPEWEVRFNNVGLVLGLSGNVCLSLLFFPVSRGSSVLQLFGLKSESCIKYHIWLGHITMMLFTAHGLCYIVMWTITHKMFEMIKWDTILISNVAGEIALLAGLAMWVTSLPSIRRKVFELFFYTHNLYMIFMVFYIFHVGFSFASMIIAGFYLFLIDRYLRFLQSQQRVRVVSARILACQAIELNFSKSPRLSYNPTSILFINVPTISKIQWHPFSITSSTNSDPKEMSIVIKAEGKWTQELYKKLLAEAVNPRLEVSLEGPYGPSSANELLGHDVLVMVSGGSGVTPFISIIRELLFGNSELNSHKKTPRKLLLVCAFKKSRDLTMLDLILPALGSRASLNLSRIQIQIQIEAYVTGENEPVSEDNNITNESIRNISFKPNPQDSPFSPILGPNTWLYLGGIIISSFVMFLVLVGVLTQFYIYPIDHNTDKIFSNTSRSALYMLFMCVSIASTSSAAFLWNKKQNSTKEMEQIQYMVSPAPPSPLQCDRELESLPLQSLSDITNVSYGKRPNLKKMLLEIEEQSVGVLASGPRKLRQEVAKICSSGLAENLHFESISFSW